MNKYFINIITKIIVLVIHVLLYLNMTKTNTFNSPLFGKIGQFTSVLSIGFLLFDNRNLIHIFLYKLNDIFGFLFNTIKKVSPKINWLNAILAVINIIIGIKISSSNKKLFHIDFQDTTIKNNIQSNLKKLLMIQIALFIYDLITSIIGYINRKDTITDKLIDNLQDITLEEFKKYEKDILKISDFVIKIKKNPFHYLNIINTIINIQETQKIPTENLRNELEKIQNRLIINNINDVNLIFDVLNLFNKLEKSSITVNSNTLFIQKFKNLLRKINIDLPPIVTLTVLRDNMKKIIKMNENIVQEERV